MTQLLRQILVTEDDVDDQMLLTRAFNATRLTGSLEFVPDGAELIARPQSAALPDLVLPDLNMPRLSGHDALQRLRGQVRLRCLPVVVLTTSGSSDDITPRIQSRRQHRPAEATQLRRPGQARRGAATLLAGARQVADVRILERVFRKK